MPPPPAPTPILRFLHLDNLSIYLARGAVHSPNCTPNDGRAYRTIHNLQVQQVRHQRAVPCGPGGVIHDYVPFYFGHHSPMMLNLATGRVVGYAAGQDPLIYLVTTAQAVAASGLGYVFTDGHGLASFTSWFDDLADLHNVDWGVVASNFWADNAADNDRQRRKQAEFLVKDSLPWSLIQEIVVRNGATQGLVQQVLAQSGTQHRPPVVARPGWYYQGKP